MRTRQTKNLYFQFESVIPREWSVFQFAEFLVAVGLIEALERDEYHGGIVRYAETETLYRCDDKPALVLKALRASGEVRYG